jgi:hypothetical protein
MMEWAQGPQIASQLPLTRAIDKMQEPVAVWYDRCPLHGSKAMRHVQGVSHDCSQFRIISFFFKITTCLFFRQAVFRIGPGFLLHGVPRDIISSRREKVHACVSSRNMDVYLRKRLRTERAQKTGSDLEFRFVRRRGANVLREGDFWDNWGLGEKRPWKNRGRNASA